MKARVSFTARAQRRKLANAIEQFIYQTNQRLHFYDGSQPLTSLWFGKMVQGSKKMLTGNSTNYDRITLKFRLFVSYRVTDAVRKNRLWSDLSSTA